MKRNVIIPSGDNLIQTGMFKKAWEDFDDLFPEDDTGTISPENEDFARSLRYDKRIKERKKNKAEKGDPDGIPYGADKWSDDEKSKFLADKLDNMTLRWPPMPFGTGDLWGKLEFSRDIGNGIRIERDGYENTKPHKLIKMTIYDRNGFLNGASVGISPASDSMGSTVMTVRDGRGELTMEYEYGMAKPKFIPVSKKD